MSLSKEKTGTGAVAHECVGLCNVRPHQCMVVVGVAGARRGGWGWVCREGLNAPRMNLRGERDGARERDGCSAARVGVDEAHRPVHVRREEVGSHAGLVRRAGQ